MKIELSKLSQLFTIIVGLVTINQWVSSNQSLINGYTNPINEVLLDHSIGFNTYVNNTLANLAIYLNAYFNNTQTDLMQVNYPTLSVSNIYYSNSGLVIILFVFLVMMLIGLNYFKSLFSVLLFGIAFGTLFNLIYYLSSEYLSPIWLIIATFIAMGAGDDLAETGIFDRNEGDGKEGADGKKIADTKKGSVIEWITVSFVLLIPIVILELLFKAVFSLLYFILSIIGCFFKI